MSLQKARELVENKDVFTEVIKFNRLNKVTALNTDASDGLLRILMDRDDSLFLFKKHKTEQSFIPFYAEADRLCLVDDAALYRLALYVGSAVLNKSLLNILFKADRELLFSFLDKQIYDYTLSYARYSIPRELIADKIIEPAALKEAIPSYGCTCLLSLAALMSDKNLTEYFTNKITALGNTDNNIVKVDNAVALYKVCVHILTQEIDKAWQKYFA